MTTLLVLLKVISSISMKFRTDFSFLLAPYLGFGLVLVFFSPEVLRFWNIPAFWHVSVGWKVDCKRMCWKQF